MRSLTALVLAGSIAAAGCASAQAATVPIGTANPSTGPSQYDTDGKYDNTEAYVRQELVKDLVASNYFILSVAKYKGPKGEIVPATSIGTASVLQKGSKRSYLLTAEHVVTNDESETDWEGNQYKKQSERFYLLEDAQVEKFYKILDKEEESTSKKKGNSTKSDGLEKAIATIKPQEVLVEARKSDIDMAVISTGPLSGPAIPYKLGNSDDLQVHNALLVVGWPLGQVKNVNAGHVTSVDGAYSDADRAKYFIFDASISPGNSGGAIYAIRDGAFELVGVTSATIRRANDINLGYKINPVHDLFTNGSFGCASGWVCK